MLNKFNNQLLQIKQNLCAQLFNYHKIQTEKSKKINQFTQKLNMFYQMKGVMNENKMIKGLGKPIT